jgi:hypothetical protein
MFVRPGIQLDVGLLLTAIVVVVAGGMVGSVAMVTVEESSKDTLSPMYFSIAFLFVVMTFLRTIDGKIPE